MSGAKDVFRNPIPPFATPPQAPNPGHFTNSHDYQRACDDFKRQYMNEYNPEKDLYSRFNPYGDFDQADALRSELNTANRINEVNKQRLVELEKQLAAKNEQIRKLAGERAAEKIKQDEAEITAMAFSVPTIEPSQTPEARAAREEKCKAAVNRTYDSMMTLGLWKW